MNAIARARRERIGGICQTPEAIVDHLQAVNIVAANQIRALIRAHPASEQIVANNHIPQPSASIVVCVRIHPRQIQRRVHRRTKRFEMTACLERVSLNEKYSLDVEATEMY